MQRVIEYQKSNKKDEKTRLEIDKAMSANIELRSKRDLIKSFIKTLNLNSDVDKEWQAFTKKSKTEDLQKIIEEEKLEPEKTRKFIASAFRDGELKSTGTGFADILPPFPMFDKDNIRAKKKTIILDKLRLFFEKYLGV